ncbi:MAG: DUF424 family protein [Candidatus Aenigmarchaeota archaeon]|nr:DUF424 family protein [Candidatus Aenigmarchaeota archaeon]
MYWTNLFTTRTEIIVAICDEDLLDRSIEFKKRGVSVKVSRHFYGGRLVDERAALKLLKSATIGNLIGKGVVALARKNGFITKENIINIDGTPHAQFAKLE